VLRVAYPICIFLLFAIAASNWDAKHKSHANPGVCGVHPVRTALPNPAGLTGILAIRITNCRLDAARMWNAYSVCRMRLLLANAKPLLMICCAFPVPLQVSFCWITCSICRAGLGGSLLGLPNLLQLLSALRAFAYGTPGAFHLIALTILIVVASSVDLVLVGMPV
jgi:hypothetical protein